MLKKTVRFLATAAVCAAFPAATLSEEPAAVAAFAASPWRETPARVGSLPGMWVKDAGFRGQWAPFRFRGSEFGQSVVLWNGTDLADPLTGTAELGFVPDAWIDSTAVFSGPDPDGAGAVGAVLALGSGRPIPARPVTDILYDKDAGGFGRTCVSFSRPLSRRLSFRFGLADRNTSDGSSEPGSSDRTIHGEALFRISNGWRAGFLHGNRLWNADLPFRAVPPGDSTAVGPFPLRRDRVLQRLRVEADRMNTVIDLTRDRVETRLAEGRDVSAWNAAFSARQSAGLNPALTWGLRVRRDDLKTAGAPRTSAWTAAAFADAGIRLPRRLEEDVQGRLVLSSDQRIRFAGSSRLTWSPSDRVRSWISFHQGLREPSPGERSGWMFMPFPALTTEDADRTGWKSGRSPNPSLHPERSENWETGLTMELTRRIRAGMLLYSRSVSDVIGLSSPGAWVNGGRTRFRGLETSASIGPFFGFSCSAALNWARSENESGFTLFDRPNVWASGSAVWRASLFGGDLVPVCSAGFRMWSEFWGETAGSGGYFPALLPAAVPLDVRVSAVIMERACLSFGWQNVMAASAALVPGYPLPARLTTFGIRWILFD
jgi:hypothetical protein